MEEKQIEIMPFVNRRRVQKEEPILTPIIVKMVMFTCMITLAMMLIYSDQSWAGYFIYGKEAVEFAVFIAYMVKRRKNGRV